MHKTIRSIALLIVLAKSTTAQVALASTADTAGWWLRPSVARSQFAATATVTRIHADTSASSRRRKVLGAAIGAALVGGVGGTYAFLEGTTGCKGIPYDRPRHLWIYPIGGFAVGAIVGAWIAHF